jgi:lysophospholipase L1-like esterase
MDAGLAQSYPFKLQGMLRARYATQTIDVANEGRPGEDAVDGSRRFPSVLRAAAPHVVILLHGGNDITFSGAAGVRRTADYLNTMAREARLYGSRVMLCTLLPQRAGGLRAGDPAAVAAYNRAVRDIARGEGAILIDFEALGFDLRLIGVDGLHPTEEGYTRMAQLIFDRARAAFEVTP